MMKTKEMFREIELKRKQVKQLDSELEIELLHYRIESVKRVLDHISDKCWKKEPIDHNLIVHCLNKLNGNIDGVEINFENK